MTSYSTHEDDAAFFGICVEFFLAGLLRRTESSTPTVVVPPVADPSTKVISGTLKDFKLRKARIEVAKLKLLKRQFALQENQSFADEKKQWLTVATLLVPIVIGFLTLYWQSKAQFELKAMELVLSSPSRHNAKGLADILKKVFPHRLPSGFGIVAEDLHGFPARREHELRLELFKALIENHADPDRVNSAWKAAFPKEEWADAIFHVIKGTKKQPPAESSSAFGD